jgi:DNA adenine methylase
MTTMKPFLKWVGGKTQILNEVLDLFPNEIQDYYEPCLGGGSVLLELLSRKDIHIRGTVYASDLNANLIAVYKTIQSNPDALLADLKSLMNEFGQCKTIGVNRSATSLEEALTSHESYYFWIRSLFNSLEDRTTPRACAMMLFLNKTCFRGIYREGPHGFNVPFGNYKHPSIFEEEHIRAVSNLIRDVIFTTCSFQDALMNVKTGDFVYIDPPYAPETRTSFVKYTADGFTHDHHTRLFALCKSLPCRFLMSNADVALVRESFPSPEYTTRVVSCRRKINSKKPESMTNEVLITNRPAS